MALVLNAIRDTLNKVSEKLGYNADDLLPDIVRLVEDPDVKKEIEFDELSIDEASIKPAGDVINKQTTQEDTAGASFPLVRINDFVFPAKCISKMTMSSTGFLPTISLLIDTVDSEFVNKSQPKDGDIISIYLRTTTSALQFIRCDFIITSFGAKSRESHINDSHSRISVNGTLFIPGFNATATNTYAYIGTTRTVMKKIAQEFHIGFAYNDEDDTNDLQNWIACNQSIDSFLTSVMAHAWKDETSFFETWVDFYYNINYVNVNKYFLSKANNKEIDTTFFTNVSANMQIAQTENGVEYASALPKVLTNDSTFKGTPMHIVKWMPVNNSTTVSMSTGYSTESYTFVHNQNLINTNIGDCFSRLSNIPAYEQDKVKSQIIFRGRAQYDKDKNPEYEQARINYDFINTYKKKIWTGIDYMMDTDEKNTSSNNSWSGNVHKNYGRAVQHNIINTQELNKMYITVICDGLNLQIQRGEYIPVYITFSDDMERESNNKNVDTAENAVTCNQFYTGYYYVANVTFNYNKTPESGRLSLFTTAFTLKRREWPAPEKITSDEEDNG